MSPDLCTSMQQQHSPVQGMLAAELQQGYSHAVLWALYSIRCDSRHTSFTCLHASAGWGTKPALTAAVVGCNGWAPVKG